MSIRHRRVHFAAIAASTFALVFTAFPEAQAHCDTMDGPVIIEAQTALEKADITPVLKWVKPEAEPEVRAAFEHAVKVRELGGEARALADQYFFDTLVRVHRAGEGAPFDGVKPAGQQEEIVMAADRALESGSAEELVHAVTRAVTEGITERFQHAAELRQHASHNVDAGREFVAAYVEYVHFVERLHNDAVTAAHHGENGAHSEHQH